MAIDARLSLHKLEVLDTVVRLGGVCRAADHLGVAQPVVSGHIRSLEERLQTKLFYRSGSQLRLTAAGRSVHLWALEMLRQTRELSRELDSVRLGIEGSVTLAASMTIGSYRLPPLLSRFQAERPSVDIRVDIIDAAHAIADTEAGINDFSVVSIATPPDTPCLLPECVGREDLLLVSSREGAPRGEGPFDVSELSSLPFIEAQRGSLRRQFTDHLVGEVGLAHRRVIMELGHPEAMKRVVSAGLGVSWLFRDSVRHEIERGELREIKVSGVELSGPVYLIRRKDRVLSPIHEELVSELRSFMAQPAAA